MTIDRIEPDNRLQIAQTLWARFAELHRHAPAGIFAAPGRVNLIGEHVDYNGGSCLPMALPLATYAAIAPRDDDIVTLTSLQQDQPWEGRLEHFGPGDVNGWPAYAAGVVWALQQDGLAFPGMDIVIDSRVPIGAGLSSSAALECSVALAAVSLIPGMSEPDDELRPHLVKACMRAEAEVAGAPTGGMDQTVAMLASQGNALLVDCRDWSTRDLALQPATAGLELLVVDTRASHALTDGGYETRRRDCEEAARLLGVGTLCEVADIGAALERLIDPRIHRRARHVLTEIARVDEAVSCLGGGDFEAFGALLDLSHDSLRDDFEVSCPELDAVVDTVRTRGALGARMTGGGFGGSAIALIPSSARDSIEEDVHQAFVERGWQPPAFLPATAADRAQRVL
ncbi:MAG: galactokinase [Actinomycetota bacterium]|nr:galactokinase [Actinomycetota bacterium]